MRMYSSDQILLLPFMKIHKKREEESRGYLNYFNQPSFIACPLDLEVEICYLKREAFKPLFKNFVIKYHRIISLGL